MNEENRKLLEQIQQAAQSGQMGNKVEVKDPNTGNVIQSFGSAESAYKAGALTTPTLGGIMDRAPVYKVGDKQWSITEPTTSSISLDKLTGDINVKVPSYVATDSEFQEQLDLFRTYSGNYKVNPKAEYTIKNSDGTTESVSLEEYINRLNTPVDTGQKDDQGNVIKISPWQSEINSYIYANSVREFLAPQYRQMDESGNVSAVPLTRTDITRMSANGLGKDAKDSTRIAVPKGIAAFEDIYKDEDWDDLNSTTTLGKLKELWYDREKTDKQEILSVYGDLGRYLADARRNPTMIENVDTEKFTAAYALYTYLSETDATCSMFRNAWEVIGSVVNASGHAAANYAVLGAEALGGVAEKFLDVTMNLFETGLSKDPFSDREETDFSGWAKTTKEVLDTKFWAQKMGYSAGEFEEAYNVKSQLERDRADLKGMLGIGVDEDTGSRLRAGGGTLQFNRVADAIQQVGTSLIQLAVAIHVGNALEGVAKNALGSTARALVDGAETIEDMVRAGTKALVPIMGAQGVVKVANLIYSMAMTPVAMGTIGLVGESIGEAIFQSPEVLAQILQSDDLEPEARAYLWDTFLGNAAALIGVTAGGKALKFVGESAWGQAVSNNMRNRLWKMQAKVADVFDGIRIKLSGSGDVVEWLDKIGSKGITDAGKSRHAQKEAIMAQQRTLRRARQAIAENSTNIKWIGQSADDILKQIDEADEAINLLMKYENNLDDILRGNNYRKLTLAEDNPLFDAADQNLRKLSGELVELQTRAGLKAADKVGELKLFAPQVSEYINAKIRRDIGNSAIVAKQASKAVNATEAIPQIEKEVAHWDDVISKFETKYGAELVGKANEYVDATKTWWQELNNMRLRLGLIDANDIAKWREEGIWGENGELYARQQRKAEQSDYVIRRRDGKVTKELTRDMGHYNWGSMEEFVDPMLVAQQEFEITAEQVNRIEAERTYSQITGTATVVDSAENVRIANEAKPYLKAYNNEVHNNIKPLVGEMDTEGVFNESIKRHQLSQEVASAEAEARAIERTRLSRRTPTMGEMQTTVSKLDDNAVNTLWDEVYKGQRADITDMSERRRILAQDDATRKAPYMKNQVMESRQMEYDAIMRDGYSEAAERAAIASAELEAQDELIQDLGSRALDGFSETFFAKGTNANKVADEIMRRYGGDAPEAVGEYLYYDALKKNKASLAREVKAKAKKAFENFEVEVDGKATHPYKKNAEYLANRVSKNVSDQVEVRFNASRSTVAAMEGDASRLVDHETWQKEIYDVANEFTELKAGDNVLMIPTETGEIELVQVDPLLSVFINSTTQYTPMGGLGRVNYLWMRLFRLGTTGLNPTSWVNQYYRDMGNAWVMGNVSQTLGSAVDELTEIFGQDAGQYLSQYSQEVQDNLIKVAQEQNKTIAQAMAEREVRRGALYAKASSESELTRLWRGTKNQWFQGGNQRGLWDKSMDVVDKIEEKAAIVNETREKYLRNLVYGNNFADAIKGGKSIEQARTFAEYIASNATTNFTRGVSFLSQFQNTIPYFRSAINGTRSFYRLWSLDPVGVTGRIVGGLVLPAFGLTMLSLSSEENRKEYKKIQAYQKENALPFVINGEAFFIPLPQELSAFVAPFRQAAESISGLGYNNGLEVIMNDLLALSPVDLGGFTDIDSWRVYGEGPTWTERLTRGGAQLFSQIMPKWATAAATAMSGYDLYTGNKIDTSHVTVDPDTGEQQVMTYKAGVIATQLNKVFSDLPAPIAQELVENLFGTAGAQLMDFLVDIVGRTATGNFDYAAAGQSFAEDVLQDLGKPMRPYIEARETADWRHTMSDLQDIKNNILSPNTPEGQAWQSMLTNKRNATTQTERDAVATARANILDPFHKQVMEAVNKLIAADPTAFTDYKLGSVLSLLNFGIAGDTVNSAASESAQEIYNQSKYAAVETMINMGFPNVNQPSILGTIKVGSNGQSYVQWNTPLQILDMENTLYAQGSIYAADIKNLLKKNGVTNDGLSAAWGAYDNAKTKEEKRKIAVEWDSKVASAIAPYVRQYGAESISNSNDAVDYLDGWLMIPSDYMRYNSKSTYNPKVNATRGYAKSFIKAIFGAKK